MRIWRSPQPRKDIPGKYILTPGPPQASTQTPLETSASPYLSHPASSPFTTSLALPSSLGPSYSKSLLQMLPEKISHTCRDLAGLLPTPEPRPGFRGPLGSPSPLA